MARLSRTVKEIINTVIFVLAIALLLTAFVCYPLGLTKEFLARPDIDEYNPDSLFANDATLYIEAGLPIDTFRVETDGLTNLAMLLVGPGDTTLTKGTCILLHDDATERDSLFDFVQVLHSDGYKVVAYDQRASGRSSGRYRGAGRFEANDLLEVIRYLDLREQITHPLYVVGFGMGGDAGILAALEDKRIDGVAAVNPYLSTKRLLDILRDRHQPYWTPLYRTTLWWWYDIRSGYSAPYRDLENIQAVNCPTLILMTPDGIESEETARIKELSDPTKLTIEAVPAERAVLLSRIRAYLSR